MSNRPTNSGSTYHKRLQASERSLYSIDFTQTLLFVQTTQVAVGLFNLPRVVVEAGGHSGWMGVLGNGLLGQVGLLIMILLMRRFGTLSLYQIMREVLGRWLGTALGLLFAVYCTAVAAVVARSYVEVVQAWLFPTTSTPMFYLLLTLPALYCATGGARVIGRFSVLTFFATAWMLLLLFKPFSMIQTDYYLPLFDVKLTGLLKATWSVFASNLGFELLMVIYPFIQKKEKALLAASLGIWTTTFIYLLVTGVAIGFFGEGLIRMTLSPTLDMFMVVELPLLQRIEHIGISTWSFLVVGTGAAYYWSAGRFLFEISKWKEQTCLLMFFPLLYMLSNFSKDIYVLTQFENILATIGAVVIFGLPTLLLLLAILRKKRGQSPQQTSAQEGAA